MFLFLLLLLLLLFYVTYYHAWPFCSFVRYYLSKVTRYVFYLRPRLKETISCYFAYLQFKKSLKKFQCNPLFNVSVSSLYWTFKWFLLYFTKIFSYLNFIGIQLTGYIYILYIYCLSFTLLLCSSLAGIFWVCFLLTL